MSDTDNDTLPDFVETDAGDDVTRVHSIYVAAGYRPPEARRHPRRRRTDRRLPGDIGRPGPLRLLHHRRAAPPPGSTPGPTASSTTTTPRVPHQHPRWTTCGSPPPTSTSTRSSSPTTPSRTAGSWRPPPPGPRTSCSTASTTTCQYLPPQPPGRRGSRSTSSRPPWHYGDWIWFRYLTERFPSAARRMPTLVRDMWRRADAPRAAPDDLLPAGGQPCARDRTPRSVGSSPGSPTPTAGPGRRTPRARPTSTQCAARVGSQHAQPHPRRHHLGTVRLDHLSSATARFVPSRTMTATPGSSTSRSTWPPRAQVRRPSSPSTGGRGNVDLVLSLTGLGVGSKSVPFDRDQVSAVS